MSETVTLVIPGYALVLMAIGVFVCVLLGLRTLLATRRLLQSSRAERWEIRRSVETTRARGVVLRATSREIQEMSAEDMARVEWLRTGAEVRARGRFPEHRTARGA